MVAALSAQLMIESSENSSWLLIDYSPTTGEITMTSVHNPLTERTSNEMNADVTSIDFSAATGGPALSLSGQPSELAKIFVRTLPESYKKHREIPFVHNISNRTFFMAWTRAMCAPKGGFSRLMRESADGQNVR
jgi:hypothetical protein